MHSHNPFSMLLLKLASRCNLKCTYCYWFKDDEVLRKPPVLTREVEQVFLQKLANHIKIYELKSFAIIFHGGEPLLFGKHRFNELCFALRKMEAELKCEFSLGLTTNGALIDEAWAKIMRYYRVRPTVSIDPTPESHDRRRIDFKKLGSYAKARQGFMTLRDNDVDVGALAVADPEFSAESVFRHFVDELNVKAFDILVPDGDHESKPERIFEFYRDLFDLWYDKYASEGVNIRYLENIIKGLLGGQSNADSIGYARVGTLTMLTDGSLEALDVLRFAGDNHTASQHNILTHELQEAEQDPLWQEIWNASKDLHPLCTVCRYSRVCGGGYIVNRWSKANRYRNPSVYCGQLYELISHMESRIFADMEFAQTTKNGERYEVRC